MAYKDFKFSELKSQFGIDQIGGLVVPETPPIEPSDWLRQSMKNVRFAILNSEKAISEWLIAPILIETRIRNPEKIEMYSGTNLLADKSAGLNGECDFIFTLTPRKIDVTSPVISIVEAKQGLLERAVAQAGAQMHGARVYNKKNGEPQQIIHGLVSDGRDWLFLRLEGPDLVVDERRFYLNQLPELLGALQWVVDFY